MVAPSRSGSLNLDIRRKAQLSIVIQVLEILQDAWPETIEHPDVSRDSDEDSISNVLRWKMVDVKNRLNPVPQLRFEREPQSDVPELNTPIGLIDIKVLYTWNDETYLTMECKRVRSTENSLALKYVRDGINRFASGKYSPGHAFGIVTGYVICDNPDGCASRVSKVLDSEPEAETGYDSSHGWQPDAQLVVGHLHYRSHHLQSSLQNTIELIHAFLAVN